MKKWNFDRKDLPCLKTYLESLTDAKPAEAV